jgi:hypothetical protein
VSNAFSCWLVPSAAERRALAAIIDRFASLLGGPRFEPHVTIVEGIAAPLDDVRAALTAASAIAPRTLDVAALMVGTTYFKSVFLALRPSQELLALRRDVHTRFALPDEEFSPHLSLYYGEPPESALATQLVARWPRVVSFDHASAWNTTGEVTCWQELAKVELRHA